MRARAEGRRELGPRAPGRREIGPRGEGPGDTVPSPGGHLPPAALLGVDAGLRIAQRGEGAALVDEGAGHHQLLGGGGARAKGKEGGDVSKLTGLLAEALCKIGSINLAEAPRSFDREPLPS